MKISQLKNIIREIIRQDISNPEKVGYGNCVPKDPSYDICRNDACGGHLINPCLGGGKCKFDDDCDGHCWCDHPGRKSIPRPAIVRYIDCNC